MWCTTVKRYFVFYFPAARAKQEKIVQAHPNYGLALCALDLIRRRSRSERRSAARGQARD
ncbi:MAG: hypothetical protein DME75_07830 [Verrucomicrobia bacterium]|nr:MAG: hypothetical protein DME75_07830 [Verrucomicrobiota bacterium]